LIKREERTVSRVPFYLVTPSDKEKKTKNKQKILLSDQLQKNENPIAIGERSKIDTPTQKYMTAYFLSLCRHFNKKLRG